MFTSKDVCNEIIADSSPEITASQIIFWIGVLVNVIASFLSMTSPIGMFSLIHQYQLMFFLLVSGAYVTDGVFKLITGMGFTLLNFDFIKIEKANLFEEIYQNLAFDQTNGVLSNIGITSGSTYINMSKASLLILFIFVINLIFLPFYIKWKHFEDRDLLKRIGVVLFRLFTFSIYIRYIIEAFIVIWLSSFSEFYELNTKHKIETASFIINIAILMLIFIFWGLWIWQMCKANPFIKEKPQYYLIEYFAGLKDKTICRLYILIFLIQRILSTVIVIMLACLSLPLKMILLSLAQTGWTIFLLIIRPYQLHKDNICEWINQLNVTFFSWMMIHYNTEESWNNVVNWISIGILILCSLIIVLILLIDLIIQTIKSIKIRWFKDNRLRNYRQTQNIPISRNEQDFSNVISNTNEMSSAKEEQKNTISDTLDENYLEILNIINQNSNTN